MIDIQDPRIARLLAVWHEEAWPAWRAQRGPYGLSVDRTTYDRECRKVANDRSKYIALDRSNPGTNETVGDMVIEKTTEEVFRIKGYGVPNKKKNLGTVTTLLKEWEMAHEKGATA